jgi:hypothetical protein
VISGARASCIPHVSQCVPAEIAALVYGRADHATADHCSPPSAAPEASRQRRQRVDRLAVRRQRAAEVVERCRSPRVRGFAVEILRRVPRG